MPKTDHHPQPTVDDLAMWDQMLADAAAHDNNGRPEAAQRLRDEVAKLQGLPPEQHPNLDDERRATVRASKLADRVNELEAENAELVAENTELRAAAARHGTDDDVAVVPGTAAVSALLAEAHAAAVEKIADEATAKVVADAEKRGIEADVEVVVAEAPAADDPETEPAPESKAPAKRGSRSK